MQPFSNKELLLCPGEKLFKQATEAKSAYLALRGILVIKKNTD
jgi:hypothetical protein